MPGVTVYKHIPNTQFLYFKFLGSFALLLKDLPFAESYSYLKRTFISLLYVMFYIILVIQTHVYFLSQGLENSEFSTKCIRLSSC